MQQVSPLHNGVQDKDNVLTQFGTSSQNLSTDTIRLALIPGSEFIDFHSPRPVANQSTRMINMYNLKGSK